MRNEPISIRPAGINDLNGLAVLEQLCSGTPWQAESLYKDLSDNRAARYWVAVSARGLIVGYIACWLILDEAEITNLSVLPEWRRRGIAGRLLQHLIGQATAEGTACIFLEVREHNQAARQLYQRAGFAEVGKRQGYYADTGETAITMSKKIG